MPSTLRCSSGLLFTCSSLLLLTTFSVPKSGAQTGIQVEQSSSSSAEIALLPDAPLPAADQQQTNPPAATPNAQSPGSTPAAPAHPQQTRRILGIMPNFSAVSADTKLPPQKPKDKFIIAAKNSFDYSSFVIAAIQSGISMAGDSYPEFHQGVAGYGRYYYHTLLDTADENFMVSGLWPVIFHQDNRFYTKGHGGAGKRVFYAVTRVLVTRNDNGDQTFNASEIIGAGSAAGLSTLYYPDEYRTWTKVGQKWLTSCIIDTANFTLKEFWPDINHKFFHTR